MNFGLFVAAALWIFAPQALPPQTLPGPQTGPMRQTFITATETVIDDASAVDVKADDDHFNGQMLSLRSAEANLNTMADDDREHAISDEMKDMIFQISSCHIQAKDGADTTKCVAQVDSARERAMETLGKHKEKGAWVDGAPR